ncbi:hypothetical protein FRB90_000458 [Tulasnella sp. 427]|nr:hypothetical protein FRB90_000458 [Tulasnella sp. 427]
MSFKNPFARTSSDDEATTFNLGSLLVRKLKEIFNVGFTSDDAENALPQPVTSNAAASTTVSPMMRDLEMRIPFPRIGTDSDSDSEGSPRMRAPILPPPAKSSFAIKAPQIGYPTPIATPRSGSPLLSSSQDISLTPPRLNGLGLIMHEDYPQAAPQRSGKDLLQKATVSPALAQAALNHDFTPRSRPSPVRHAINEPSNTCFATRVAGDGPCRCDKLEEAVRDLQCKLEQEKEKSAKLEWKVTQLEARPRWIDPNEFGKNMINVLPRYGRCCSEFENTVACAISLLADRNTTGGPVAGASALDASPSNTSLAASIGHQPESHRGSAAVALQRRATSSTTSSDNDDSKRDDTVSWITWKNWDRFAYEPRTRRSITSEEYILILKQLHDAADHRPDVYHDEDGYPFLRSPPLGIPVTPKRSPIPYDYAPRRSYSSTGSSADWDFGVMLPRKFLITYKEGRYRDSLFLDE